MQGTNKITEKSLKLSKAFVVAALASFLFSAPADASLVYQMTPSQMVKEAKEIRIGEVVSSWSSPDPKNKMIFTYIKVRVDQTLKGVHRSEILLRQPGGSYTYADNGQTYRQQVFGMETFEKGEKAVFFIDHAADGAPLVMFQGKHTILDNPQTKETQAIQIYSKDIHYINPDMKTVKSKHAMFEKREVRKLGDLIQEIEMAVKKEGEAQQ